MWISQRPAGVARAIGSALLFHFRTWSARALVNRHASGIVSATPEMCGHFSGSRQEDFRHFSVLLVLKLDKTKYQFGAMPLTPCVDRRMIICIFKVTLSKAPASILASFDGY